MQLREGESDDGRYDRTDKVVISVPALHMDTPVSRAFVGLWYRYESRNNTFKLSKHIPRSSLWWNGIYWQADANKQGSIMPQEQFKDCQKLYPPEQI